MNAARKLAESLRNLLPTNREAGRVRRKGEEPVDIESLRAIKVSICAVNWEWHTCHCGAEIQDRKTVAGPQDGNGSCVTKRTAWILHLNRGMSARPTVPMLFCWKPLCVVCMLVHSNPMVVYTSVTVLYMPLSQCCMGLW